MARFEALAPGEGVKVLAGLRSGWKDRMKANRVSGRLSDYKDDDDGTPVPDTFDSAQRWPLCAKIIGDIRDQGNCGCCWAFAGAEVSSDRLCIATNGTAVLPISAQDVCFCTIEGMGCFGGDLDGPFFHVNDDGAVTGGQYNASGPFGGGYCSSFSLPHCHHHGPRRDDPYPAEDTKGCPEPKGAFGPDCPTKCDKGAEAPHDHFKADRIKFKGRVEWAGRDNPPWPSDAKVEKQIMRMVMKGGPVSVGFTVYTDFENYAGGIYHQFAHRGSNPGLPRRCLPANPASFDPCVGSVHGDEAGGHAVKLVGWGEENGVKYWRLANSWNPFWGENGYFRIKRGVKESCGLDDSAVAPAADVVWKVGSEED